MQLNENNSSQQAYTNFKSSFTEIEKRCVKHQKGEIDAKRQLSIYQTYVVSRRFFYQRKNQDLTEQLSANADDYKTLLRNYNALECKTEMNYQHDKPKTNNQSVVDEEELYSVLHDTRDNQQQKKNDQATRTSPSEVDVGVCQCPICDCQFPPHLSVREKNEHIETHLE
jgi:hypothetical protein